MPITIHNIRLGLATNSSSTHSMIFLPGAKDDDVPESGEFGWGTFTLATEKSKRLYLAAALYENVCRMVGVEIAATVAEAWAGVKLQRDGDGHVDAYIDHQSRPDFPRNWRTLYGCTSIDMEFFEAYKNFLLQDGLVVLGGNDNDDRHPLASDKAFTLGIEEQGFDSVARYDKAGDYWTIFNRRTGAKVRLSFSKSGATPTPTKAFAPELVDVKITDYCTQGCAYCYQGSTPIGRHAGFDTILKLVDTLGYLHVFEVALGGGEPTQHPHFIEIVERFRAAGVVPNFTTRRLDWLHDPESRKRILEATGAWAYTIEHGASVAKFVATLDHYGVSWHEGRVTLQYVMGACDRGGLLRVLEEAYKHNLPVTLLGFKRKGRGETFVDWEYRDWVQTVGRIAAAHRLPKLSIDTALVAESLEALKNAGVPPICYHAQEGKFSMYVDAVEQKCGPSSYESGLVALPQECGWNAQGEAICKLFEGW